MIAGRTWADIVEEEEAQLVQTVQVSQDSIQINKCQETASDDLDAVDFGSGDSVGAELGFTPAVDVSTSTTGVHTTEKESAEVSAVQTSSDNKNGFVKDIVKKWHEHSKPRKVVTIVKSSSEVGYHHTGKVQDSVSKGRESSIDAQVEQDEHNQVVVTFLKEDKKLGAKKSGPFVVASPRAASPLRVLSRDSSFEKQGTSESSDSTLATVISSNSLKGYKYVPPYLRKTLSDSIDSGVLAAATALDVSSTAQRSISIETDKSIESPFQHTDEDTFDANMHAQQLHQQSQCIEDQDQQEDIVEQLDEVAEVSTENESDDEHTQPDEQPQQSKLNVNAADFQFNVNAADFTTQNFAYDPQQQWDMAAMYNAYGDCSYGVPYYPVGYPCYYDPYYEYSGQVLQTSISLPVEESVDEDDIATFSKPTKGRGSLKPFKSGSQAFRRNVRNFRDVDGDWKVQKELRNKSKQFSPSGRVIVAPRNSKQEGEAEDNCGSRIIEVPISTLKKSAENNKEKDNKQFKLLLGNQGEKKEIVVGNEENNRYY